MDLHRRGVHLRGALEKLIENASAILLSLSAYVPDTPGENAPEARLPMERHTLDPQ